MRLSKIKLAGFKSFVDPTIFHMPERIVTVVGPNGCGKSNIIDAVRWVMGESAASHLRGDSMEDVIFNGSSTRKPVGQASVELLFDNSQGRLGGAWAEYGEIAIKRLVERNGQSRYFLNGSRCRRRDITDIFLGTGLGPRSYAIIEQGMITRIIESKPDELRVFLEEAAGVSKYKERRREAETRMRHTTENLVRVNDLAEELDRQIKTLHRQARNAERYQQLRAEERQHKAELLALKWRGLERAIQQQQGQLQQQENDYQAVQTELTAVNTAWLKNREAQQALQDQQQQQQAEHYQQAAALSRLEQTIEHQRQLRAQHEAEHNRLSISLQANQQRLEQDQQRQQQTVQTVQVLETEQIRLEQQVEQATRQYHDQEQIFAQWQQDWEQFRRQQAQAEQQSAVEKTRIEQLERAQLHITQRAESIQQELNILQQSNLQQTYQACMEEEQQAQQQLDTLQTTLNQLNKQRTELQNTLKTQQQSYQQLQTEQQTEQGKQASLQTLQDEALQATIPPLLASVPTVMSQIEVEPGWETAIEMVLAQWLGAHNIEPDQLSFDQLLELAETDVKLVFSQALSHNTQDQTLASKARLPQPLKILLSSVQVVANAEQVLRQRQQLGTGQSIISPDGVWAGSDWLRGQRGEPTQKGILKRQQQLRELAQQLEYRDQQITKQVQTIEQGQQQLQQLEQQLSQHRDDLAEQTRIHARLHAQTHTLEQRIYSEQERAQKLTAEATKMSDDLASNQQETRAARTTWQQALSQLEAFAQQQQDLVRQRQQQQQQLQQARKLHEQARQTLNEHRLQLQKLTLEQRQLTENIQRLQNTCKQLETRQQELLANAPVDNEQELQKQLQKQLQQQQNSDNKLAQLQMQLAELGGRLKQQEQAQSEYEQQAQTLREHMQNTQLACKEEQIRQQNIIEQLNELDANLATVLETLAAKATETEWLEKLTSIGTKIQRLGAINLAAIDEHTQATERKALLDTQQADLHEALALLEQAISKIDRETRSRFKVTFEQVNQHLAELYPRLFGGGKAYLELTGTDSLDAGLVIIAKPPGKRAGKLQLLSGGEKALTAIAFIFSIFQLNPAPFCMLDEVDAPLDDTNVARFGTLVEELSQQVQFILVTHNKITMEIAQHLAGITMHEPGVSRLVAVDVDEALRLAEV